MHTRFVPEDIIQEVLQHSDIVEVIGKYVHLTKQGKNLKGLCPFHSEKTPSFTVSPEKQLYYCFGCGAGGNAIKFLMETEGSTFPEAVRTLAEQFGVAVDWPEQEEFHDPERDRKRHLRGQLLEAHELAAKFYHYLLKNTVQGKEAMRYLTDRGFTHKMIDTFLIGYAPPMKDRLVRFLNERKFSLELLEQGGLIQKRSGGEYVDRFRDRIMFPIFDMGGKVIAFAGRVMGNAHVSQPKYLNSPETILFNKRNQIYNLHKARPAVRRKNQIVLFEGYVDVIKAWEAGVENGVATMGTALSEQHAALIRRYASEVIVCYDGDRAGQAAAVRAIELLEQVGCVVRASLIPDRLDPDEYLGRYGKERFVREIIEGAVSSTSFKLLQAKGEFDLSSDQGKLAYVRRALAIIADRDSPTEREHHLRELSSRFGYSLESLKQETNELRRLRRNKKRMLTDNIDNRWNNVRNRRRSEIEEPALLPAYYNAERYLLALMMQDGEIAHYVQEQLGDQFNVEMHAALAAYLYAYYDEHEQLDLHQFLSILQNEKLEQTAVSISMIDPGHAADARVVNDYIATIKKYAQRDSILQEKREEMRKAEQAGDILRAAQIAKEIISLERDLRSSSGLPH